MAKASRLAFGEALARLGGEHPEVVVLDADLSKSTMTDLFARKYPERFFDLGIAEGNMVGVAAGMALAGKVPFCCSFACFVAGRFEQIRMSVGYNRANVRIVGTHAGIGIGEDGYSQMATEDIACMRSIPNMAVVQPADAVETERAVEYLVRHRGPVFLRLTRQKLEDVNPPDYRFEFGRGVILKEGGDVTLLATGGVVWEALKAAEALAARGFAARVVNIHTIKPLDEDVILDSLRRTRGIVTVEDHGIHGGMGSAVAEAAAQAGAGFVRRIGVRDFAESGDPAGLYRKYGLSAEHIVAEAEKLLR